MSWIAIVIVLLALWLALKVAKVAVRLLLWAVVIGVAYWLLAPHLGLPLP